MLNIIKKFGEIYNPPMSPQKSSPTIPVSNSLEINIQTLQSLFKESVDLTVKRMYLQLTDTTVDVAVVTMEGLINSETLATSVTNPISRFNDMAFSDDDIFTLLERDIITNCDNKPVQYMSDITSLLMAGFACVMLEGCTKALMIGVQGYATRAISEPDTEVLQRGSREGFVEPIKTNMAMLRRKLKNTDLKFESMTLGSVSHTDVCLCYLNGTVSTEILDSLRKRLQSINLETVFASGYLVSFLEKTGDDTIFSGVGVTERPDTACAKLHEGKIVILVDGTPSALIVPHIMVENFQTLDDYSNKPYFATLTRWLKYLSFLVSIILPGLYVAFASYNPEFFPSQLLTKVATSISKTPFSAFTEVILFTLIYEIMREAGLRLPKSLGHAVSIIGGLVIGDTAVSSGFIGAPTLMIVALTVICSYVIPDLYAPIALLRFLFIIFGGLWGVWGIVMLFCALTVNICAKESFGVPFMSPIAPFDIFGLRDVIVRADWKILMKRNMKIQNLGKRNSKIPEN